MSTRIRRTVFICVIAVSALWLSFELALSRPQKPGFSEGAGFSAAPLVSQQQTCQELFKPTDIPAPGLINFDDLANAAIIGDHYRAAYGVTFESNSTTQAIVYGNEPAQAQSPPNVASNNAVFPNTSSGVSMRIFFDRPKTHVGFWMGNGDTLGPIGLMTAYDAFNAVICQVSNAPVPEPHTEFIGIYDPEGRIASVSLDYGVTALSESIDDLYFAPYAPTLTPPVRAAGYTAYALAGGDRLHYPYVARNAGNGWTSMLAARNMLSVPVPVTLTIHGGALQLTATAMLAGNGSHIFDLAFMAQLPDNFIGSATLDAPPGGGSLVGAALVRSAAQPGDAFFAYDAIPAGTAFSRLWAPIDSDGEGSPDHRHTIIAVQNADNVASASVIVRYFDETGSYLPAATSLYLIPPNALLTIDSALNPNLVNFSGVALIESTGAGLVGLTINTNDFGDTYATEAWPGLFEGSEFLLLPLFNQPFGVKSDLWIRSVVPVAQNLTLSYYSPSGTLNSEFRAALPPTGTLRHLVVDDTAVWDDPFIGTISFSPWGFGHTVNQRGNAQVGVNWFDRPSLAFGDVHVPLVVNDASIETELVIGASAGQGGPVEVAFFDDDGALVYRHIISNLNLLGTARIRTADPPHDAALHNFRGSAVVRSLVNDALAVQVTLLRLPSGAGFDNFEPNDRPEDAYPIRARVVYTSFLSHPRDFDWYAIYLTDTSILTASLTNLS
ncbi:MAG TPA: hypothetical protein VFL17_20910, partial [Anaerolineae bacterium]|nr:hypothetical protein [Anaerolineae bacterium]